MDFDALLDGMTPQQLDRWFAFHRVEPFDQSMQCVLLAIVASLLANQWKGENDAVTTPGNIVAMAQGILAGGEWELPVSSQPDGPEEMMDMLARQPGVRTTAG